MLSVSTNGSIDESTPISVYFNIHYHTNHGDAIYIVGDTKQLGIWMPQQAIQLQWNKNDEWTTCIYIDRTTHRLEYKFIVTDSMQHCDRVIWEPGENRILTQHTIQSCPKQEYYITEIWGYRTIKLKLNHNLPINQKLMIIGSIPELGSWQSPLLMKCQTKKDILNDELVQQWSYQLIVNPTNFGFRYYYIIRNDDTGHMIWERGNGRSLNSRDLNQFRIVQEHYAQSPIRVKTQLYMNCQMRQSQRNGSFMAVDTHQQKQRADRYKFADKGTFFYYEAFGQFNKLDWNFITTFTITTINENIIIGPYPQNNNDILILKQNGVKAVLNLQTRLDIHHRGVHWHDILTSYHENQIHMVNYEIFDMDPQDFQAKCCKAVKILKKLVNQYELVYVHCTAGIGRAPSVVVLYLCSVLNYTLAEAIELVKQQRQQFYVNIDMLKGALNKTLLFNNGLGYGISTI